MMENCLNWLTARSRLNGNSVKNGLLKHKNAWVKDVIDVLPHNFQDFPSLDSLEFGNVCVFSQSQHKDRSKTPKIAQLSVLEKGFSFRSVSQGKVRRENKAIAVLFHIALVEQLVYIFSKYS